MVTNLVSTIPRRGAIGGSAKVFFNLVMGLDAINSRYIVNRQLRAAPRLWIHNDVYALPGLRRTSAKTVLGPNLFELPQDIPRGVPLRGTTYVLPSQWKVELWLHEGYDASPLIAWPVGIDTATFRPPPVRTRDRVLVYFKQRSLGEIRLVEETLSRKRIRYGVLSYGRYSEAEYLRSLQDVSFVIWVGGHESQGIAMQEALACDVPVLVWDATSLGQATAGYRFAKRLWDFPVTSAPYFDDSCGMKIYSSDDLSPAIDEMSHRLGDFRPRSFVVTNLSLASQARSFLSLWEGSESTDEHEHSDVSDADALVYDPIETLTFRILRRFGPKLRRSDRAGG